MYFKHISIYFPCICVCVCEYVLLLFLVKQNKGVDMAFKVILNLDCQKKISKIYRVFESEYKYQDMHFGSTSTNDLQQPEI